MTDPERPIVPAAPFSLDRNERADRSSASAPDRVRRLWRQFHEDAWGEIQRFPNYRATALRKLRRLAHATGVGAILYKDEADRFGLGSFKASGSVYAVFRAVNRCVQNLDTVSQLTVVCASDGNHGRAVAWGARLIGCRCVVFLPSHVSIGRERAIAELGARPVRIDGNYDDVRIASTDAKRHGWIVVSDTSEDADESAPLDVMCGYMAVPHEAVDQLDNERDALSHVFVQAGVGGLAAAACAYFWQRWGVERPTFIVVESDQADCLRRSAMLGRPTVVTGEHDTIMAGLACGAPSAAAWSILERGADYFMAISDDAAIATMRLLAGHCEEGGPIVAGESGVAGLAAFLLCADDRRAREALKFDSSSRVLVIGTEGATDPEKYASIVNRDRAAGDWRPR